MPLRIDWSNFKSTREVQVTDGFTDLRITQHFVGEDAALDFEDVSVHVTCSTNSSFVLGPGCPPPIHSDKVIQVSDADGVVFTYGREVATSGRVVVPSIRMDCEMVPENVFGKACLLVSYGDALNLSLHVHHPASGLWFYTLKVNSDFRKPKPSLTFG